MIYLVVWFGGEEPPQYEAFRSISTAMIRAEIWAADMEEGVDTVDVLKINTETLEIERVETP